MTDPVDTGEMRRLAEQGDEADPYDAMMLAANEIDRLRTALTRVSAPCPNDCQRFGGRVPGHTVGSNWDFVPCQVCAGTMVVPLSATPEPGETGSEAGCPEAERLTAALQEAGVLDFSRPGAQPAKRTEGRVTWDASRTEAALLAAVLEHGAQAARDADGAEPAAPVVPNGETEGRERIVERVRRALVTEVNGGELEPVWETYTPDGVALVLAERLFPPPHPSPETEGRELFTEVEARCDTCDAPVGWTRTGDLTHRSGSATHAPVLSGAVLAEMDARRTPPTSAPEPVSAPTPLRAAVEALAVEHAQAADAIAHIDRQATVGKQAYAMHLSVARQLRTLLEAQP